MEKNPIYDKLIDSVEKSEKDLIDLCLKLGNTASYRGKEAGLRLQSVYK